MAVDKAVSEYCHGEQYGGHGGKQQEPEAQLATQYEEVKAKATTAPSSGAGRSCSAATGAPMLCTAAEWPVVTGGFQQDTPGELVVQATWAFLKRMRVSNELMQLRRDEAPAVSGPGGDARGRLQVQEPYMVASRHRVNFRCVGAWQGFHPRSLAVTAVGSVTRPTV